MFKLYETLYLTANNENEVNFNCNVSNLKNIYIEKNLNFRGSILSVYSSLSVRNDNFFFESPN